VKIFKNVKIANFGIFGDFNSEKFEKVLLHGFHGIFLLHGFHGNFALHGCPFLWSIQTSLQNPES